jgi:serine/threonine-protein kinase RsbW
MPQEPGTWSTKITLKSERGAGQDFLQELLDQLHAGKWPDAEVFGIHLAIEEAVVNAIRHGNQFDPDKSVQISCRITPQQLWVSIEDEGPGFDPCAVPDCTCEDRLEVPSGRGVMLMRCFMNHVEYNTCGNRVIMEKHRGEPVPAAMDDE